LDNRITFGISGEGRPMLKAFLTEAQDGVVPNTWWSRNEVGDNKEATLHLKDLFHPEPPFSTPKPTRLVQRCIQLIGADSCLDFFAGSGTTGEAAIALTRKDKKKRRYYLCESGEYFDTILLPRLKKNIHSDTWKEGKPTSRNGISHAFKYIRLESYEDALNNLELRRSEQQGLFLDADAEMREQYTLSYMLDVESRGSQSLLNVEAFRNPDEYKLRVERNGETQLVNVDLVETFNWLLGLTVKHIDVIRGVRVVEGTAPNGERVLVLWRNIDQMDNDALDKWFEKQDYNTREMVYDVFYVNGDNNLENLRRLDQTWKVRLIEEEFKRLMFDVEDV
jgi:adenine-specific DNA-methyltransferase